MRRLARLLPFGAVGLLLTVLTAWGPAIFGWFNDGNLVATYESRNTAPPAWLTPEDWDTRSWHATWGPGIRSDLISEQVWMGSSLAMTTDGRRQWTVIHVRVGFPMYAMRWLDYASHLPEEDTRTGRREWLMGVNMEGVVSGLLPARRIDRRIPLRPIWTGFALNWVFYAACAWGVYAGARAIRAAARRRKGLCQRCGYPRPASRTGHAGSRCPECGA
ncbi:MAG: hypothetical protein DYG92_11045 [Leptolyngbya sp. PLA1]|nr:hypothetical protein [Leptolyngbya sp. PLA1]